MFTVAAFALATIALATTDVPAGMIAQRSVRPAPPSACGGERPPLPASLEYRLRSAVFPGAEGSDVTVHVPRGFDATRRPGMVLYFHGWRSCAASALAASDVPCETGGEPHTAANLAKQVDDAGINALLVVLELRVDMPTGEPGALAMPGGLRAALRELLSERLTPAVGCAIEIDALDRVVVVAHSGGYQAAASALRWGDVAIHEVVLLDALYGARDVFEDWILERPAVSRRFVDLYTCCGGTEAASRDLADSVRLRLGASASFTMVERDGEPESRIFEHPVVFERVPRAHGELPRVYVGAILATAEFAPIRAPRRE